MSSTGEVDDLITAAAVGGQQLIAATAAAVRGWAALVDPVAGPVYWWPAEAAVAGRTAATRAEKAHSSESVVRLASGAVLVVGADASVLPERRDRVAGVAAGLFAVRGGRAGELRNALAGTHAAAVELLLVGRPDLALRVAPGGPQEDAEVMVYRLAVGENGEAAHQALWRVLVPAVERAGDRVLLAHLPDAGEVAVVHSGEGPVEQLLAQTAKHWHLLGGAAGPVPLPAVPMAWSTAAAARGRATAARPLASGHPLADRDLLSQAPAEWLRPWAAAVLAPLSAEQRRWLEVWLTAGTLRAAAPLLGLTIDSLPGRLRGVAAALGADLEDAAVRARLLIALRVLGGAPPEADPVRRPPLDLTVDCVVWLLSVEEARAWALSVLTPLTLRVRTVLRAWLELGRVSAAAERAGVHRNTVPRRVARAAEALGADLRQAEVRGQVYLALLTADVTAGGGLPSGAPGRGSSWRERAQQM
ncbi:PucR family transcriptional regulator [Streptomyces sp. SM12]|uniref:PucR family transcriptional regulator n=1 Tax=Streptomyces sp. SM12 TaxID=1071602 RepID=UPI000CD503AF|nr:PucR family transcriptional regulator [Streptomyces sp. SM12]